MNNALHILNIGGFSIMSVWENEFDAAVRDLPDKDDIIEVADDVFIDETEAYMGGRAEAFANYKSTNRQGQIYGADVASLCPFVMAMMFFLVGQKSVIKNITPDEFNVILAKQDLVGSVKCDVKCPKNPSIPVLPSNIDGRLMFDLHDKH